MADEFNTLKPQKPINPEKDKSLSILAELNKTFPGVDQLVSHSTNNVANNTFLRRPNGDISTISSITVGIGDREFLIPTIFDGRQVPNDEAIARAQNAMSKGLIFPSAPAGEHKNLDEIAKIISENLANVNGINQLNGLMRK